MTQIKEGYNELCGTAGSHIEECVKALQERLPEKLYINFNGHILYSDTVTMDSAYLEVMGMTKANHDAQRKSEQEEYEREERAYNDSIPMLTEQFIERGHKSLTEDKWKLWDDVVPIRLGDLYRGMELGACLDVIEAYNSGKTLDECKDIVVSQGHSGMSFGLMCSMFKSFMPNGNEFVEILMK